MGRGREGSGNFQHELAEVLAREELVQRVREGLDAALDHVARLTDLTDLVVENCTGVTDAGIAFRRLHGAEAAAADWPMK